jgi:hypothetical protein
MLRLSGTCCSEEIKGNKSKGSGLFDGRKYRNQRGQASLGEEKVSGTFLRE